MKGTIIKYNGSRGFGFIRSEELDKEIFVHIKSVTNAKHLTVGDLVTFETEETPKGLAAVSVKVGGEEKPKVLMFAIAAVVIAALALFWVFGR